MLERIFQERCAHNNCRAVTPGIQFLVGFFDCLLVECGFVWFSHGLLTPIQDALAIGTMFVATVGGWMFQNF